MRGGGTLVHFHNSISKLVLAKKKNRARDVDVSFKWPFQAKKVNSRHVTTHTPPLLFKVHWGARWTIGRILLNTLTHSLSLSLALHFGAIQAEGTHTHTHPVLVFS